MRLPFRRKRAPRKTPKGKKQYDPNFPSVKGIWEALDKSLVGEKKIRQESALWARLTEMYKDKVRLWDLVAEMVDQIDNPLIQGQLLSSLNEQTIMNRLQLIFDIVWTDSKQRKDTMGKTPNFGTMEQRVEAKSDLLKLWYGCVGAAKIVAQSTASGPNSKQDRKKGMHNLNWAAREDMTGCVALGIGAGPFFRHRRAQSVSYAGIPKKELKYLPSVEDFYTFINT